MKLKAPGTSPELLLRHVALYLLAFAWPWGVYQTERLLFLPFTALPVALLGLLEVRALLRGRRPRIPAEFMWPLAVLAGAAGVYAARRDTPGMVLVLFLEAVTVLVLLQAVRSRVVLLRCLALSVWGGTSVAFLSLFIDSRLLVGRLAVAVLPAGYSPSTGASLAFAHTVPNGVLVLLLCAVLAAFFLIRGGGAVRRVGALVALVILMAALGRVALEVFAWPRTLPTAPATIDVAAAARSAWHAWRGVAFMGAEAFAAAVALLWLISRAWGKVFIAWRSGKDGIHVAALVALAIAGVCVALLPLVPHAGSGVVLGLLVRHAFPWREEEPAPGWPAFAPVLLLALVLANVVRVDPENPHDPRNYAVVMRHWLETGRDDDAVWLARLVWSHSPAERRNAYLLAQDSLTTEPAQLDRAAHYVVRMTQAKPAFPAPVLPPPTETEREALLTRLRDTAAAAPLEARGFAYERALVAIGQPENALEALRYRIRPAAARTGDVDMMADVVAWLLGAPELAAGLRAWDAAMLWDVLTQYAPGLATRTEDVDALAVVSLAPQGAAVQVWPGHGVTGIAVAAPPGTVTRQLLNPEHLQREETAEPGGFTLTMPPGDTPLLRVHLGTAEPRLEVQKEAWGTGLYRPLLVALP